MYKNKSQRIALGAILSNAVHLLLRQYLSLTWNLSITLSGWSVGPRSPPVSASQVAGCQMYTTMYAHFMWVLCSMSGLSICTNFADQPILTAPFPSHLIEDFTIFLNQPSPLEVTRVEHLLYFLRT